MTPSHYAKVYAQVHGVRFLAIRAVLQTSVGPIEPPSKTTLKTLPVLALLYPRSSWGWGYQNPEPELFLRFAQFLHTPPGERLGEAGSHFEVLGNYLSYLPDPGVRSWK